MLTEEGVSDAKTIALRTTGVHPGRDHDCGRHHRVACRTRDSQFHQSSQGISRKRVVNDARQIDAAINAWALEVNASDGTAVDLAQAAQYTKSGAINPNDALGNPYLIGLVGGTQTAVSAATKLALAGVAIDWGAY